jgi:hypothetical protein
MFKTREELKTYILSKLGSPVISIELDDAQINYAIDFAITKFSNFSMDGEEPTPFLMDTKDGVYEYELDDRVQSVVDVRFKPSGFAYQFPGGMIVTPSDFFSKSIIPSGNIDVTSMMAVIAKMSMLDYYFNIKANYNYNGTTKRLRFFENPGPLGTHALLLVYLKYEPKEYDNIYGNQWVIDYSLALCKEQWGENLGKYDGSLIGGATVNYARLISEAKDKISTLEDELLSTWTRPLPILRG